MSDRGPRGFDFARIRIFPGAPAVTPQAPISEPAAAPDAPAAPPSPALDAPPDRGSALDAPPDRGSALDAPPDRGSALDAPPDRGSVLDACARLHWDRGRRIGSYRACGLAGFFAGLGVVLAVARMTGAAPAVTAAVAIVVPSSFLLAVRLSRAVFGYERIVFFEKALFSMAATALAVLALGHEVGAALDLAALGIGTFLGLGRVGCLMVGCCHGRPSRWGIRYGVDHARAGLPWYHVGRRLFPIQLVDGLASLVLVLAGVAAVRSPHPPGAIAAGYLLGYGAVRFFEEPFRGDAARPRLLGLSEAQWTAVVIAVAIVGIGRSSRPRLDLALASLLAASALGLSLSRRRLARTAWGLTSPWHLEELHRVLLRLDRLTAPPAGDARVLETSEALCVSLRRLDGPPPMRDYVLSFPDRPLPLRVAAALAEHARFAPDPAERVEVRAGATPGIVHVVVWAPPPTVERGAQGRSCEQG